MNAQRLSAFRLEFETMTEEAQKNFQKAKEAFIRIYDIINDFILESMDNDVLSKEANKCFAIAQTKLEESIYWTNRGLQYNPKSYSSEEN